ncbi:MAG: family 20 glycosylhydrolase, partial [Flavobacteriales bacterium]
IQIDAYPKLTEIGAWRKPNQEDEGFGFSERMGGFYSKADIREIVAYAAQHHVAIIPEIELPGHSVAAIASYPWLSCTQQEIDVENEWGVFKDIYCAGNDSVFHFLETVLSEVCELFPGPFIHIGGDEAPKFRWEHCEKCQRRIKKENLKDAHELQTYFIERVAAFLQTKGKRIIGWDEIMEGGIPADAAIQSWRGMDGGLQAALQGHAVVMSPTSHCYLDYPLSAIDALKVYHFQPIPENLPADRQHLILGAECNMWSEHTPEQRIDAMVFPRLLSMAEVLWKNPATRTDSLWMKQLLNHYPYMQGLGLQPGFPVVPVKWNLMTQGEKMRYTCDVQLKGVTLSHYDLPFDLHEGEGYEPSISEYHDSIVVDGPAIIELMCQYQGAYYKEGMQRKCYPHPGMRAELELGFEPSPYYPGSGSRSLLDGQLGSKNFRDGLWQAVPGKNVEAIVHWPEARSISHFLIHWYQYSNAWIFAPAALEFYTSQDGVQWESVATMPGLTSQQAMEKYVDGSFIIPFDITLKSPVSARFVKMVAVNFGPCPTWHDAPGGPSWLFYDEWIIE